MPQNKDQISKDYMKNIFGTKKRFSDFECKNIKVMFVKKWNIKNYITESRKLEIKIVSCLLAEKQ